MNIIKYYDILLFMIKYYYILLNIIIYYYMIIYHSILYYFFICYYILWIIYYELYIIIYYELNIIIYYYILFHIIIIIVIYYQLIIIILIITVYKTLKHHRSHVIVSPGKNAWPGTTQIQVTLRRSTRRCGLFWNSCRGVRGWQLKKCLDHHKSIQIHTNPIKSH